MRVSTHLVAGLIGFVLILAGQGMAFARTQAPAEGKIVLCTGHGVISTFVDKDGHPTSAPQLCMDCVPALADDASIWDDLPPRAMRFYDKITRRAPPQLIAHVAQPAAARAPPSCVI